ncbi:hypothetical protein D910_11390 [Dendroctonus ponderosae]|uniref:VPS13-like middle region domain-containing protein n=1 Tax=Dendroctonus ponderosae TaxID=77166 RepID=U4UNQ1_DENPD|nr:hypothetical protein D910_11390 [Dendroctonus ponderosae]
MFPLQAADAPKKGNLLKTRKNTLVYPFIINFMRSLSEDSLSVASSDSGIPPRSMIDVTYQQTGNDMFADIRIFSFTLILSVEYLMKIAEFFSNPADQQTSVAPVGHKSVKNTNNAVTPKPSRTSRSSQSVEATNPSSQITLNLKVEQPDIILVEHMDNIDSKAMILNSEIVVKLRMSGEHQVINGVIKDLQLYTCNYNPAKRAETKGNVLHPVTISLAGSTPVGKGLHLELLVEEVLLRVSPATIELLNSVLVTMSKSPTSDEAEEEEQFNFASLWEQKSFRESDFWFLKGDDALEATEDSIVGQPVPKTILQELCIISMPSIVITLEAGVANKTLPFLLFETSLKGCAKNWASQLGKF